jgi:transposase
MDNAKIHHDADLISLIEGLGCRIIFLPPYSPDYNPIKTAFSTIKLWIKRNCDFMEACDDPIYALLVACSQITQSSNGTIVFYVINLFVKRKKHNKNNTLHR